MLSDIRNAFSRREKPLAVINSVSIGSALEDYEDALFFEGKDSFDVTCEDFETHPDCVYRFNPEAFLYYLPGIYCSSFLEARPDLLVVYSIVFMLDRGNAPNTWDDFFCDRWLHLTVEECEATQKWLLWLSEFSDKGVDKIGVSRAFDTISLIASKSHARPMAKPIART